MMVVDGAYVFLGCRKLIESTQRRLILTAEKLTIIDNYIQSRIKKTINEKHFITAEVDKSSSQQHFKLYNSIVQCGY